MRLGTPVGTSDGHTGTDRLEITEIPEGLVLWETLVNTTDGGTGTTGMSTGTFGSLVGTAGLRFPKIPKLWSSGESWSELPTGVPTLPTWDSQGTQRLASSGRVLSALAILGSALPIEGGFKAELDRVFGKGI